jgi:hypothetical protein
MYSGSGGTLDCHALIIKRTFTVFIEAKMPNFGSGGIDELLSTSTQLHMCVTTKNTIFMLMPELHMYHWFGCLVAFSC